MRAPAQKPGPGGKKMAEIGLQRYLSATVARTGQKCRFKVACLVVLAFVMARYGPGWDGPQRGAASIASNWLETATTADHVGYSGRAVSIDEHHGAHISVLAQEDINGAAGHLVVLYCLESSPPCAYVYKPATLKDIEREKSLASAWPSWGALPAPYASRHQAAGSSITGAAPQAQTEQAAEK